MLKKDTVSEHVMVGRIGPYPRVVFRREVFSLIDKFAVEHSDEEYGGILVGEMRPLKGPQKYQVVVEGFIPLLKEEGVSRFSISSGSWEKAFHQLESTYSTFGVVGWIHTHPGFGIFLSALDKEEHQRFFPEEWQIAYVLDPDTMSRGMYHFSESFKEIKGYSLAEKKDESKGDAPVRNRRVEHMKLFSVILFWIVMVTLSVFGLRFINSFSPIQRGRITVDVSKPLPSQIQMKGGITILEDWEAQSDDRGTVIVEEYQEYQVVAGDSLWRIAEITLGDGRRYEEIVRLNGLTGTTTIRPGMILRLPTQ